MSDHDALPADLTYKLPGDYLLDVEGYADADASDRLHPQEIGAVAMTPAVRSVSDVSNHGIKSNKESNSICDCLNETELGCITVTDSVATTNRLPFANRDRVRPSE